MKMKKKMLTFSLAAAMLAGSVFSVSAAGVKDVLSSDYYAGKYSDLKKAYGTDKDAYVAHFLKNGAKEGRIMNPILDVVAYRKAYADLDAAFGDDWDAYVNHYLTVGIKEGRVTGVLFDLVDYANKNADLKAVYGDDYVALANQYVTSGIKEGRAGGVIAAQAEEDEEPAAADNGSSNNNQSVNTPKPADTPEPAETPESTKSPVDDVVDSYTHVHDSKKVACHQVGPGLDATCTTDGYVEYQCDEPVMVNRYDDNGKWTGTEQKTINGKPVYCDEKWRETVPASHVPAEDPTNIFVQHPTCTQAGYMKYTCTRCGESVTQIEGFEQLRHDWKTFSDKDHQPKASWSCQEEGRGYYWEKCKNCGEIRQQSNKELLNHRTGSFPNVDKPATCTSTGISYGYCDMCGVAKVENIIPRAEHSYGKNYKTRNVAVYADSYLPDSTEPTHIKWTIDYCNTCGEITHAMEGSEAPCKDGDGDGACDDCGLPISRPTTNQIMEYHEGDKYVGKVQ